MEYIIGNKEEFYRFLDNIKDENIAILSHDDLDGIASAVFLKEILEKKDKKISLIRFLKYNKEIVINVIKELEINEHKNIIISDFNIDTLDINIFNDMRKKFNVFLIDHHPFDPQLKEYKNIIKAESSYCASLLIWDLGKEIIDKKYNLLLYSSIIADYSYKNKENLRLIQKDYPEVNENNIMDSIPGKHCLKLAYFLIYFQENLNKAFDIIYNNKTTDLEKYYNIIDKEINKIINDFNINKEYYIDKGLYFYRFKSKYAIISNISSYLSSTDKDKIFIIFSESNSDKGYIRISARNQSIKVKMNDLLKRSIEGMENSNAGGHDVASGARIMKKDLDKFKENVLKNI